MAGFPGNVFSAQELVAWFYERGIRVTSVESDYTISTTAVAIGKAVTPRIQVSACNTGTTSIAIAKNPLVTITTGFLIEQFGNYISTWYYDFEVVAYPLYAISSGSGGTLHVEEIALSGV
jgi:hypothetical protein